VLGARERQKEEEKGSARTGRRGLEVKRPISREELKGHADKAGRMKKSLAAQQGGGEAPFFYLNRKKKKKEEPFEGGKKRGAWDANRGRSSFFGGKMSEKRQGSGTRGGPAW